MIFRRSSNGINIVFFIVFLLITTSTANAGYRRVLSLAAGADLINFNMNQNVTIFAPFQNNYSTNTSVADFAGGLFAGIETDLMSGFSGQLGIAYYVNSNYEVAGNILQFNDPNLNTVNYQYFIRTQRVLLEGKLLCEFWQKYHPYITAGIGEAFNRAHDYNEIPTTSQSLPMVPGFASDTLHSFTYQAGVGIEMDVAAHTRLGGMYRYAALGNAQLGPTPLQDGTQLLHNNALHVNEFLLQISYIG